MLEFLIFALLAQKTSVAEIGEAVRTQLPEIEILEPTKIPQKKQKRVAPRFLENEKTAILALDLDSGKTLLEKNADRAQNIASLTKIMTALVILDEHELDEIVSIPLEATRVVGAKIDLYQHERLTVRTLLEAALIPSANDAALALAIFDAGSEEKFVEKMNRFAKKWNLKTAKFLNATGLDIEPEFEEKPEKSQNFAQKSKINSPKNRPVGNEMSPRDLLRLTRRALRSDFFRQTVKKTHFYGTSVDEKFFHEKKSTNQLLGTFLNLHGVKTGYTRLAGECLIALGEKDGHEILTVILGSADRFGETKNFLSWIYDVFEWK